ncbi:MAG: RluA family pseudouridine synthase [Pseudomonadota bacterium]|nr:RluA family pseudouridine synthase [Pseudomonadota bacterium]
MFVTLHQDRHIQVLDKPVGIDVVPARSGGPSIEATTGLLVCHRLDRETSGCLVMARTLEGQRTVSQAFAEGRVHKEYLAVVVGHLPSTGEIDLPIGEWKRGRVQIGTGRPARTRFEVRWRANGRAGIVATPLTGRTHQIRAHLASRNAPLLGDPTYGGPEADRLYLHAWRVRLPESVLGPEIWVESPIPPGFEP